ncbi:madf domain transcription factor [Holotrichia oblita]|uniref:Uncharacterized protein n=2 Tax=Holotrichia oblita TaxID=644536 RepID=A0ACB9SNC5_HOLOL|nr:hypothetical protein MML48_9g00011740 [Holotrichia oblita]KAI4455500.1 madf domain transcription factor [Holotrichia oblita]
MSASKKKKLALALLLLEDEILQDEIDIITAIHNSTRNSASQLFQNRNSEGAFKVLIHRHLLDDEVKFKQYFRVTRQQFSFLLDLVKKDLNVEPCNRVRHPISPPEKLGLTLR